MHANRYSIFTGIRHGDTNEILALVETDDLQLAGHNFRWQIRDIEGKKNNGTFVTVWNNEKQCSVWDWEKDIGLF